MSVAVIAVGFFGKLPARGDFVRAGLPRAFVDPWDAWLQRVLPASRKSLGEAWRPAWVEAPVWRFSLPACVCGPKPVLGLWMPSIDSAGRYFPLTLVQIGGNGPLDAGFLSAAEAAGRAAVEEDWAPDKLLAALGRWKQDETTPSSEGRWRTEGSPRRPAWTLTMSSLPDEATFALMLDAGAAGHPS